MLPFGASCPAGNLWQLLMRLTGWLITGLAVSLGAPFWFDLLQRFVSLRGAGRGPRVQPQTGRARTASSGVSATAGAADEDTAYRGSDPPAPCFRVDIDIAPVGLMAPSSRSARIFCWRLRLPHPGRIGGVRGWLSPAVSVVGRG